MSRARHLAYVHAGVLLFGLAALVGKIIDVEPVALVWWRNLFAAAAMALAQLVLHRRITRPKRPLALFVIGGVLAAHWIAFFAAMKIASVTVGLLGFATFPIVVALIEPLVVPGEQFRWSSIGLALLAAGGVALVVPNFDLGHDVTWGAAIGVASGVLYAVVVTANRRLVADTSALELGLFQNAAAFVWLLPRNVGTSFVLPDDTDLGLLVVLGVFLTGLAHVVFVRGMAEISARTASIIGLLEPVYGIAAAALILSERAPLRTWGGGAIILSAVAISSLRAPRRQ